MSHPTRSRAERLARRSRRHKIEPLTRLEDRWVMAPLLSTGFQVATFTAAATPSNANLGTITVATTAAASPAPLTSVTEFAPLSEFGNNLVRIKAGPGGEFGQGLYAITRGNVDSTGKEIGTPGVIYRLDPATGRATQFFDLNTVLNQLEPGGNASNSLGNSTGLVNWYDIAFDPNGVFDGRPSMFVSSVDRQDPNKNVVYRIGTDGSFLGAFVAFTAGSGTQKFNVNPTSILIPPSNQQSFLRGLFVGNGTADANGAFTAYFFNANAFSPQTALSSATTLPPGVVPTALTKGPQVGLTAANTDYTSPIYSAFTNFGTPGAPYDTPNGGIPARPGLSGLQGLLGEFPVPVPATPGNVDGGNGFDINAGFSAAQTTFLATPATATTPSGIDRAPEISTPFRRFQDISFDQYGYFSYNHPNPPTAAEPATLPYAGSMFVSDLASGLAVSVTPIAPLPTTPILVPVTTTGGTVSVGLVNPSLPFNANTNPVVATVNGGTPLGGRIVRVSPTGVITNFATNFDTTANLGSTSFYQNSLTLTFSADGTTMWASDDTGIWQFKTVTDLASSTSGSLVGLNDLRTLGVPYNGFGSAVAVIDTGVDATNPAFRGRVANGTNVLFNNFGNGSTTSFGNQDFAPGGIGTGTGTTPGGVPGGGTAATQVFGAGHGTPIAGVVAQFVPQATIQPINVFAPPVVTGTGTGGTATASGPRTSFQLIYQGLEFAALNPFVKDPVHSGLQDRLISSVLGFGTQQTFGTETAALQAFPQATLALKNAFHDMRTVGIQPIAAAGQLGTQAAGATATPGLGDPRGMSFPAILNEVISATGVYPFPINPGPTTTPLTDFVGVVPQPPGPLLVFGAGAGTVPSSANLALLTAADATLFKDKLLSSANRNTTTDYAAPAIDIPTFSRTTAATAATAPATGFVGSVTGNSPVHLNFLQGGTSLSAAMVTGSFALVSSAVNYWSALNATGVTSDAYLTTPVGARTLNFGPRAFVDLSQYANPDGVNAILQWTAVPAIDNIAFYADGIAPTTAAGGGVPGVGGTTATPTGPTGPRVLFGTNQYPAVSRISVSNAVAAIEGTIALNYLMAHNDLPLIDANHDGLITAQEIQNFVDKSNTIGLPEAGAMARLLGGTARIPGNGNTLAGQTPDQPDALQRRFNFFDYAANGRLLGAISLESLVQLSQHLLPPANAFSVIDRQRASANGYLLAPGTLRDYTQLQHRLPRYEFIPAYQVKRFHGISPDRFHINRNQNPFIGGPTFALFDQTLASPSPTTTVPTATAATTVPTATTSTPVPTATAATTAPTATAATTAPIATAATTAPTVAQPSLVQAIERAAVVPGSSAVPAAATVPATYVQPSHNSVPVSSNSVAGVPISAGFNAVPTVGQNPALFNPQPAGSVAIVPTATTKSKTAKKTIG